MTSRVQRVLWFPNQEKALRQPFKRDVIVNVMKLQGAVKDVLQTARKTRLTYMGYIILYMAGFVGVNIVNLLITSQSVKSYYHYAVASEVNIFV